jgi:hypothetical protein
MSDESVCVVFRPSSEDDPALWRPEDLPPSISKLLIVRASGSTRKAAGEPEDPWLIVVEVDPQGANLDPEDCLRHCRDFLVDSESGEGIGVVDDVELAAGSDRAVALIVASGWFGRHVQTIDVADVQAILPTQRRLIVKDAAARPPRAGRRRA